MPTIYIDADACPVTAETISVCGRHRAPVVVVGNESQNVARLARRGVEVVEVGSSRDAADFAIVGRLATGDIVVTCDIGLAAMSLGRGARALTWRGRVFRRETIDAELQLRHAEQRHRRSGGRIRGPAPFADEDRDRFRKALERLLREGDA